MIGEPSKSLGPESQGQQIDRLSKLTHSVETTFLQEGIKRPFSEKDFSHQINGQEMSPFQIETSTERVAVTEFKQIVDVEKPIRPETPLKVNIGLGRASELLNLPAVAADADRVNEKLVTWGGGVRGIFEMELKLLGAEVVSGMFITKPELYNEINTITDEAGNPLFKNRSQMDLIERVMGPSVLTTNDDAVKDRRAKMGRILAGKKLSQEYAETFREIVWGQMDHISAHLESSGSVESGSVEIDANEIVTKITQGSIVSALFGGELNYEEMKKVTEVGDALRNYFAASTISEPVGKFLFESSAKKKLHEALIDKALVPSTIDYLEHYKLSLVSENNSPVEKGFGELIIDMIPEGAGMDEVATIIEALKEKDYAKASEYLKIVGENGEVVYTLDNLLADEAIMFLAGVDTTAAALQNILYFFVKNPDIQRDFLSGNYSGEEILDTILNVRPPVGLIQRESRQDVTLSNGVFIPAGTIVSFPLELLNRKARQQGMTDFDVTFAKGPRSCLGEGFARREILEFLTAFKEIGVVAELKDGSDPKFTSSPAAGVRGLDLVLQRI